MREDLVPDVSMGTHFFSELVEMEMLYLALFPEKPDSLIAAHFFLEGPNHIAEALPEAAPYAHVIRYLTPEDATPGARAHIYADPIKQQFLCYIESV
ncbi:MAG: hypothetical protein BWY09_02528 [Candidatus Hydrogenedentes bacterium ADurb.Bin179]|nr:MAG: hypothetical protein BWY09_02528 [Candidatus Hydrogenedentes bacterium ADurb.Bin179]